MALPDGTPWPFYIVLRKDDTRLKRHSLRAAALAEAARLAAKEGVAFNVLRLTHRVEVEPVVHPSRVVEVRREDATPEDYKRAVEAALREDGTFEDIAP
jgi:hypothetical protein